MRIHLVVNTHRRDAVAAAQQAAGWLSERSIECSAEADAAPYLSVPPVPEDLIADADVVICFGGDGTLMRAAHMCSSKGTPILGVYFGRFGFVTQCKGPEIGVALSLIVDGQAKTHERMMLETSLVRQGQPIAAMHSLNEVVLQRAVTARMMVFDVEIDGHAVARYPADGVMVATATGSTAYNLSAGGPIMDPSVHGMILNAIAPHTLSARPLVLRPEATIKLRLETEGDAVLSADGHTRLHLLSGDEVIVSRSPRVTRLVAVDDDDFLVKLGERLFWAHSVERGSTT